MESTHTIPAFEKLVIKNDLDYGKGASMSDPMAMALLGRGNQNDGGLFGGGGLLAGLLFGGLLGNRNGGGLFGGGNGGGSEACTALNDQTIMQGINALTSAVPNASLTTQNAILSQTNEIQSSIGRSDLANAGGFANTKDAVQNSLIASLTATNAMGTNLSDKIATLATQVAEGNCAILQKIDANTIANLQAELAESRHGARAREVEVNVTQNVNQNQMQQQQQANIQGLTNVVSSLVGQLNRNQQDIINLGTMVASGNPTATNTNIR